MAYSRASDTRQREVLARHSASGLPRAVHHGTREGTKVGRDRPRYHRRGREEDDGEAALQYAHCAKGRRHVFGTFSYEFARSLRPLARR